MFLPHCLSLSILPRIYEDEYLHLKKDMCYFYAELGT